MGIRDRPGTTFGSNEVVVVAPLVEVRAFRHAKRAASKDVSERTDKLFAVSIVFLQYDAAELGWPRAVIPDDIGQPFPTIVVVKERRVKTT